MIWGTTSNIIMYGFWKQYIESYSKAIYGTMYVETNKEKM
jgi:hypothetical protein